MDFKINCILQALKNNHKTSVTLTGRFYNEKVCVVHPKLALKQSYETDESINATFAKVRESQQCEENHKVPLTQIIPAPQRSTQQQKPSSSTDSDNSFSLTEEQMTAGGEQQVLFRSVKIILAGPSSCNKTVTPTPQPHRGATKAFISLSLK